MNPHTWVKYRAGRISRSQSRAASLDCDVIPQRTVDDNTLQSNEHAWVDATACTDYLKLSNSSFERRKFAVLDIGRPKLSLFLHPTIRELHISCVNIINLLAGGISEAGALQAGDLLQDLKCGHLLGASPKAQFYGQLIGSGVGAIVSAAVYKLYTKVYEIPGDLFQVPTGFVWVFTARLVTGQGLPDHSPKFAATAFIIWALLTALRIYGQSKRNADGSKGASWVPYVPGGIAVAVGMYNVPSFTLARTVGGLIAWWWMRWRGREETTVIVLASGLILGEGILSIVNLALASGRVPHL